MTPGLAEVARGVRELPPLPAVVLDALHSFDDPNADVDRLADSLSRDQAIAVKTLRLANSSFYGLSRKVSTIPQAITVLGLDCVRTLVASIAIIDHFSGRECGGFDQQSFWRHSLASAVCSRHLARHARLQSDHAFVCGLLLDIGEIVLAMQHPAIYAQIQAVRRASDCDSLAAERQVLGYDHATIGRLLAEQWKFPTLIQRAIGNHHAPDTADLHDLPSVVHIADALVRALDLMNRDDERVPPLSDAAWDSLALSDEAIMRICEDTEAQYEDTCKVLGL